MNRTRRVNVALTEAMYRDIVTAAAEAQAAGAEPISLGEWIRRAIRLSLEPER